MAKLGIQFKGQLRRDFWSVKTKKKDLPEGGRRSGSVINTTPESVRSYIYYTLLSIQLNSIHLIRIHFTRFGQMMPSHSGTSNTYWYFPPTHPPRWIACLEKVHVIFGFLQLQFSQVLCVVVFPSEVRHSHPFWGKLVLHHIFAVFLQFFIYLSYGIWWKVKTRGTRYFRQSRNMMTMVWG